MSSIDPSLQRRLEELASLAGENDVDRGAPPAMAAAATALRAELGAVRADFSSLRAEVGAVRADLDGFGGRLSSSVSAGRTETAGLVRRVEELAARLEGVAGRVEELRASVPALNRELREGLAGLPQRTGERIAEATRHLSDSIGSRLDAATTDVRRSVTAGLEQATEGSQATEAALTEIRNALEARIAALEDTLDTLAEGFEAFARDGASTTQERLRALAEEVSQLAEATSGRITSDIAEQMSTLAGRQNETIDGLAGRIDDVVASRLDTLGTDVRSLAERTDALGARIDAVAERTAATAGELTTVTRTALDDLGSDVEERVSSLDAAMRDRLADDRSAARADLEALGERLSAQLRETADGLAGSLVERVTEAVSTSFRETLDEALAQTVTALGRRVGELTSDVSGRLDEQDGFLEALQDSIESRIEGIRGPLTSGLREIRGEIGTELTSVRSTLDELAATSATGAEGVTSLRVDLADALEEVRDRIADQLEDSAERIQTALDEAVADMNDVAGGLRSGILDRVEETSAATTTRLSELGLGLTTTSRVVGESTDRLGELEETVADATAALDVLRTEWSTRTGEVVAEARAAADATLDDVRGEIGRLLRQLTGEVSSAVGRVAEVRDDLDAGTDRLAAAGEGLIAYLAERDRVLEAERDRVLHELLDDFAAGLSAKERRALSLRMSDVLERRRDARDADRWRRAAETPAARPAKVPGVDALAALAPRPTPATPVPPTRADAHIDDADDDIDDDFDDDFPDLAGRRDDAADTGPLGVVVAPPAARPAPKKVAAKKAPAKKAPAKKAPAKAKKAPSKAVGPQSGQKPQLAEPADLPGEPPREP